jgi:hypothetical protein
MEALVNWVNPAPTMAPWLARPSLGDLAPSTLEPWLTSSPKFFKVAYIYRSKTLELKPSCKVSQTGDTGGIISFAKTGGENL